jgi:phosphatidylinositol-3-phosphatase
MGEVSLVLSSPTGWRIVRRACALAGAGTVAGGLWTAQAAIAAPTDSHSIASTAVATTGPATCPPGYLVTHDPNPPPATPPHIMEIMMENASFGTSDGSPYVIGNPKAPYINNTLIGADKYTSLTNWDSIQHNSPLDYMDAISGCDHNGFTRPYPDPTLVNELDGVGTTWKAYMDGLAAGQNCYLGHGAGTNGYVQNHNPFIYFKQIISNTSECDANVVPYFLSGMSSDLNSSSAPDFVWITPSVCDDMHSRCAPLNNLVLQGDTWLANNLPTVLASKWYTQGNGIVIITWDEGAKTDVACPPWVPTGTSCGGHIATLVITQNSCGSFSGSGDEFGILHGIETAYGVDYLNNSGGLNWNPGDDITPALCLGSSPPAIVQQTVAAAKATSTTFSVTTPSTTAGDLLAITTEFDGGSGHASGSVIGVTDNMLDTWTRATGANPATRIGAEVWDAPNAAAGVTSVTVTYSTSVNPVARYYEVSNATSLDVAASAAGASTAPSSGATLTTSSASEVVIGAIGFVTTTAGISGLPAGFTNDALLRNPLANHQNSEQAGYDVTPSTATFSYFGTLSSSQSWAAVVAAFK